MIKANDHVVVVGKPKGMEDLEVVFGNKEPHRNRILLIGCGIVAFILPKL